MIRGQRLGDLGGNRWSALIDEEAVQLEADRGVECLLRVHCFALEAREASLPHAGPAAPAISKSVNSQASSASPSATITAISARNRYMRCSMLATPRIMNACRWV